MLNWSFGGGNLKKKAKVFQVNKPVFIISIRFSYNMVYGFVHSYRVHHCSIWEPRSGELCCLFIGRGARGDAGHLLVHPLQTAKWPPPYLSEQHQSVLAPLAGEGPT